MSRVGSGVVWLLLAGTALVAGGCAGLRSGGSGGAAAEPAPRQRLERAERLLAAADLDAAAAELHALVEDHPASPEAPQALFQLAVVYLAPGSPLHDASQGILLLRDLAAEYPGSSWAVASGAVLELAETNAALRQVSAELQDRLDRLKQIDIGADG